MKNKKMIWLFLGGVALGAVVSFFATAQHYGKIDLFKSHASEPETGPGSDGTSCDITHDDSTGNSDCLPYLGCTVADGQRFGTCQPKYNPRGGNTVRQPINPIKNPIRKTTQY